MKYAKIKTYIHNGRTALEKDEWREPYLSLNKMYPIDAWYEDSFDIAADDGEMLFCLITECSHLGGGDWEIIEVEDE